MGSPLPLPPSPRKSHKEIATRTRALFAIVCCGAVAGAGPLAAQESRGASVAEFALTESRDVLELLEVDLRLTAMERAGDLELVTSRADRTIPGRVHESLRQLHRGVPVHGAGVTRQRQGGVTVSILGRIQDAGSLEVEPGLSPEEAMALLRRMAGTEPLRDEPPALLVFPTPHGGHVLVWKAAMRDLRTWFIDASTGESVHVRGDVKWQQPAVGFGPGITGALQKVSVARTEEGGYLARDRLRPVEIVTLDAGFDNGRVNRLLGDVDPATGVRATGTEVDWRDSLAADDDNRWQDPAVVDVHAHLGLVYDYFHQRHGWSGMDGQGRRRLFGIVNMDLPNAFFAPPPFGPEAGGVLAFGGWSGLDDSLRGSYATPMAALDLVTHEVMHGVTHESVLQRTGEPLLDVHTAASGPLEIEWNGNTFRCGAAWLTLPLACRNGRFLLAWNQGGAVNEGFSDIFAMAVEFSAHPPGTGPLRADYLLAEDIDRNNVLNRSIENPGSIPIGPIPTPDSVANGIRFLIAVDGPTFRYTNLAMANGVLFALGGADYDGVHWNSTILSHAFYLAIEGGPHASNGAAVEGVGAGNRDQIEAIFFRALTELMPAASTFETTAAAVRQSAIDLHGAGSPPFRAVDEALAAVGL